jgi:predicted RNA-binding protein YlqC (UPF0109 family)
MSENTFAPIVSEVSRFAESANDLASLQKFIVEIIPQRLTYCNWAGFYMLDSSDPETPVLGPFRGAATNHIRIVTDPVLHTIHASLYLERALVPAGSCWNDVSRSTGKGFQRKMPSLEDERICRLVDELVKALVDNIAAVRTFIVEENGITTVHVQVAPIDLGKVLGKQGRTARSIRVILSAAAMKLQKRYALDILRPDGESSNE